MTDTTETDLAIIPKESALAVLTNAERFDEFIERVAKTVRGVPADLTTSAGRKAVAALAFKVVKSKTAILAAADDLTADARDQIRKVNASKADIETRLNALRDEVRKPLTDWEAADELREEMAKTTVDFLRRAAIITTDATVEDLKSMRETVVQTRLDSADLGDHFQIAMNLRDSAVEALNAGIERAEKAAADAAELAALRAQQAARDAEDQARRDREETARLEELHLQSRRDALEREQQEERDRKEREEQEERDRIANEERIAREAREQAQREADERAEAERQETERRHELELAEQREATERAEKERQRLADEAAAREAQEAAESAAAAKRQKDRAHKAAVMATARDAIALTLPVAMHADEKYAFATTIVRAIVAGNIPAVTLAF